MVKTRRSQRIRFGTRAAQSAGRFVANAAKKLYSYNKFTKSASKAVGKTAKNSFLSATVGRTAYKYGRRAITSMGLTYTGGNDYSKQSATVGYKKKPTVYRLNKLLQAGMNTQVYRFQNITNFDTTTGAFPLCNWQFTTNQVMMPFHVYDLTSFNNNTFYSPGKSYFWSSLADTADVTRFPLPGQSPDGTADAQGHWHIEEKGGYNPLNTTPNASKFVHNWSDIRLLLYGARKRTTRFDVMFFRINDEFANLHVAAATNNQLKELCQYIERPSIYSPLQSLTSSRVQKSIRMIKKFTYYISAAQTTDVDTAVGKTKEVRIFLRHGKVYNLDYKHTSDAAGDEHIPHTQSDGLDYTIDVTQHNHPWYGSQVFMVVRAFAPERVSGKEYVYPQVSDANIDPSYDIIIRNSVSTPA